MNLSDEQKKIGKENFAEVIGTTRRDFLKELTVAGAVSGAGLGAAYFHYDKSIGDRLRIGIIGTGDEGNVLIGALNPNFIDVVAISDIRPSNVHRALHGDWTTDDTLKARPGLMKVYGWKSEEEALAHVKVYRDSYQDLLDDPNVEAVIIALPLWLHDVAAIDAMRAGKHVLTEKLMAHSVAQCKEMARVAYDTGLLLATGHQRHYSVLYDNAVDTIRRGLIGDIHHIRAQWHRGNLPGNDSWSPPLPEPMAGYAALDAAIREAEKAKDNKTKASLVAQHPLHYKLRSFRGSAAKATGKDANTWAERVKLMEALVNDSEIDAVAHGYQDRDMNGYQRSALEELIRWRLWDRTGGGLMAELGSHQLDAAGIFISAQFDGHVKANPLSVVGVGGRHLFPADRDVDDHVYCSYEFPGKGYYENNDLTSGKVVDPNKKVVVTYSSINGNGFGGYGEVVLGTKGTLILEREQDTYLFAGSQTETRVKVAEDALVPTYETGGGYATSIASPVAGNVSRGYTEEIEHWAWCIRNKEPITTLHCHPKVALSDAVIALVSNIAMRENRRIEFDPKWFDPMDDATPDGRVPRPASELQRSKRSAPIA